MNTTGCMGHVGIPSLVLFSILLCPCGEWGSTIYKRGLGRRVSIVLSFFHLASALYHILHPHAKTEFPSTRYKSASCVCMYVCMYVCVCIICPLHHSCILIHTTRSNNIRFTWLALMTCGRRAYAMHHTMASFPLPLPPPSSLLSSFQIAILVHASLGLAWSYSL